MKNGMLYDTKETTEEFTLYFKPPLEAKLNNMKGFM